MNTGQASDRIKAELRERAQATRRGLGPHRPALQLLLPLLDTLQPGKYVLTWLPARFEPDPTALAELTDRPLAVTRTPAESPLLTLHPLTPGTRLERHRLGFMQPAADSALLQPHDIGLALIPGLAFDAHGGRLGHGGGHYDRLLARLRGIPLVGVTHSSLLFDGIPMEEHDVPMTHVLTERGLYGCG